MAGNRTLTRDEVHALLEVTFFWGKKGERMEWVKTGASCDKHSVERLWCAVGSTGGRGFRWSLVVRTALTRRLGLKERAEGPEQHVREERSGRGAACLQWWGRESAWQVQGRKKEGRKARGRRGQEVREISPRPPVGACWWWWGFCSK